MQSEGGGGGAGTTDVAGARALDAVQDGVLDLFKVGDAAVVHEQQPVDGTSQQKKSCG
jgi:hypothetical protein